MKAYITSIGERTTELSKWALERQGFEVVVIENKSSLWEKLYRIYSDEKDDFLRVDADVVVNRNVQEMVQHDSYLWYQALTYDWWKQDITHGGVQFIRKDAIPIIREHIMEAEHKERPESYLFRLEAFHNPRQCGTYEEICGLNGYRQDDVQRVKATKERRNQYGYDWELALRLNNL